MPIIVLIRVDAPPIKIKLPEQKLLDDTLRVKDEIWEFWVNGKKVKIFNILVDKEHAIVIKEEEREEEIEVRSFFGKSKKQKIVKRIFHCISPERFKDLLNDAVKIADVEKKYQDHIEDLINTYERIIAQMKDTMGNVVKELLAFIDEINNERIRDKIKATIDGSQIYNEILNAILHETRKRAYARLGLEHSETTSEVVATGETEAEAREPESEASEESREEETSSTSLVTPILRLSRSGGESES